MEKGKNIMGIEFNNKNMSSSYIGAFDVDNPEDQKELKLVKGMVAWANKSMAERGDSYRYRVCLRCLLYTSPSPRDRTRSRMPSSA